MRIKSVGLEDHRHAPRRRHPVVTAFIVQIDLARRHRLETGDHPQEGRVPAPGRTNATVNEPIFHDEIDTVDDFDSQEALADVSEFQLSQECPLVASQDDQPVAYARGGSLPRKANEVTLPLRHVAQR